MSGKLTMLSAGAGAGKTSRLSYEILQSIKNGVAPENIVATTFTTKAADELIERVRLKLLEAGDAESAARILDGYVGTMNSVFGRLLREFAMEMGLSPVQKVLAETEATTLFDTIAAEEIDKCHRDYHLVFQRLGQEEWSKKVLDMLKLARENGMGAQEVRACADYSWTTMSDWLPDPLANAKELDDALKAALIVAKQQLPGEDQTKKTQDAVGVIRSALADWDRNGFIPWQMWAKLSKLDVGKSSRDAVAPILTAASVHARHPRLHQDMKEIIYALFTCAAEAMETYAVEKRKRGLIDFTDQESLALQLLKDEKNIEALKDRISDVFVDEFQDSSPLQIALNMQLRELAQNATWVGDVKQAIYGFRGTDPELMQIAMTSIPDLNIEILDASYRSRKSLVEFVNAIFVPVFEARGMSADRVALDPKREDKPEQALSVEAWSYPGSKNQSTDAAHLAYGVLTILNQKEQYILMDKITRDARSLKAGDIAILCRSNDECVKVASALSQLGIPATVGEGGLMATAEVVFAVAAMRYLVDASDTLSLAELIHFSSDTWGEGSWLNDWLQSDKGLERIRKEPLIQQLDNVREKIGQMSPSEVLELALVTAKADLVALSWGQGDQRLANLDALRKLAIKYEDTAGTNGTAATAIGFLLFLNEVERDKELNLVAESTNDHAVRVLTYHKAKGLEWPFVIMNSLEKSSEKNGPPPVFERTMAVSTTPFNVQDPLHGRRLYYWPWPYGKTYSKVGLDAFVENAPELQQRKQQLLDENQRLLYVGMTRARDYLVFAARDFSKVRWIQELTTESGHQVLSAIGVVSDNQDNIPQDKKDGKMIVNGREFPCAVRALSIEEEPQVTMEQPAEKEMIYVGKRIESAPFLPARFSPSRLKGELAMENTLEVIESESRRINRIGSRLPLSGNPDMAILGEMVHAFLAADSVKKAREERLKMAQTIMDNYGITALTVESMLEASERLEEFLTERYPDIIQKHREWPVHLQKGWQKASGWIDLLLSTPKGWVIVDHKTFPGKEAEWLNQAKSYLPQLQTYAEAIHKATGQPVYEVWIHMPVVGAMIHFTEEDLSL